jgi:type I restriction enzyme R subunit
VRIVSEEGATGKALLEKFQNTEAPTPVVATTVDLLTTGVDAPSVRNVVFMKPLSSIVTFKQIIGRGSRLCPDTDKFWFRIVDYTNASRLFDAWDRPSEEPEGGAHTGPPFTGVIAGVVRSAKDNAPIAGARVFLQTGPNEVTDQYTGPSGQFVFTGIGTGRVVLVIMATDHRRVQQTHNADANRPSRWARRAAPNWISSGAFSLCSGMATSRFLGRHAEDTVAYPSGN